MIEVEAAAGGVFARFGLQLWVRRDGLSLDFLRRIDFPNNVLLHWARGVFVEAFYVLSYFRPIVISKAKVMQTLLAQGEEKGEAGRRAAAGRHYGRAKSWHEERRDNFLNGSIAEQHRAGKV